MNRSFDPDPDPEASERDGAQDDRFISSFLSSSIIHHPSSIIHHPSSIIHHPSSIIHN
jgi:hypothetical protein